MNDIGIIGLAVMGRSLALNMADHGYRVSGYNRSYEVTQQMEAEHPHPLFHGYQSLKDFVASLATPRKIMLMVKAGQSVDTVLAQLVLLLDKGDILMDGGNSFFQDTIRRSQEMKEKGLYFFGVGVSGGEQGARNGPSIMPGGDKEAYAQVADLFVGIAATASDGAPCCTYIGENGAGHYVKMVHNGIEYADMQIIAEAYLILKYIGRLRNEELAAVFHEYDQAELNSYLIHITAAIFEEQDDQGDGYLLDRIKDCSAQKGTGKWTSEEALHQGVDVSMITAAYHARINSSSTMRTWFQKEPVKQDARDHAVSIDQVKQGIFVAKIVAYAQGFDLLQHAAKTYEWQLDFEQIAAIFRSGCIIQARFLDDIMNAYHKNAGLPHLLMDTYFKDCVMENEQSLRTMVAQAILQGIPVPALSNAIAYLDMLKAQHVGANLIQAQRDYFGAHTFERDDMEGSFHHEWLKTS